MAEQKDEKSKVGHGKMKYGFEGGNENELTVVKDEVIEIIDDTSEPDWTYARKMDGSNQEGYIPTQYFAAIDKSDSNNEDSKKDIKKNKKLTQYDIGDELVSLINNGETNQFIKKISEITSNNNSNNNNNSDNNNDNDFKCDINFLLNEYFPPLIAVAAKKNNDKIVNKLLTFKVNVNQTDKEQCSALLWACHNGNEEMTKLLMSKGANPNAVDDDGNSTLTQAAYHGNIEIIKSLINENNEYKESFAWTELINHSRYIDGYCAVHYLCMRGHLNCIKYLLKVSLKQETKINWNIKTRDGGRTPFFYAVNENHTACIKYLISNVFANDENFDINQCDKDNNTILRCCAFNGNVEIGEILFGLWGNTMNVNTCDNEGQSPAYLACARNNSKFLSLLMTHNCDINLATNHGWSPLDIAAYEGHLTSVNVLCNSNKLSIKSLSHGIGTAAEYGQTAIFSKLVSTFFVVYEINDFESLVKSTLLGKSNFDKWFDMCLKNKNHGLLSFLMKINENGMIRKDFGYILSLLENAYTNDDDNNNNNNNNNINDASWIYKSDMKRAKYWYDNSSDAWKSETFKIFKRGILNYDKCFDDTILFVCYLINNNEFIDVINKVTGDCLSNKTKTVQKQMYFKNNLLDSNIWVLWDQNNNNNTKDTNNSGNNNNNNNNNNGNDDEKKTETRINNSTIFDTIRGGVITDELKKQQEYIKKEMLNLATQFSSQLNEITKNIKNWTLADENGISQNYLANEFDKSKNYMSEDGVLSDYQLKDMPYSNENGFNGETEYDYQGYLNKLLLFSHNVNPIFQKECKEYFNNRFKINNDIDYTYMPAPVKTKDRSQMKAKIDYNNKKWPTACHLLDTVRCSVTFHNIQDFIKGYNIFKQDFQSSLPKIEEMPGIIKCIVRIKNDFSKMEKLSDNLADYTYMDIKFNVLIEYNKVRLISEIQFLLKFMLKAKKLGHSIYAFERKKDFFDKLNKMINNNNDNIYNELRGYILLHNMSKLSLFFENMTENELKYILKNKSDIYKIIELSHWEKGKELFDIIISKHDAKL